MKHILYAFLAMCLIIGITDDGYAFRCGSEVVGTGDSVATLQARCGRPGSKDYATEKFRERWESVEKWYYNCGGKDFIYMLTIVHSKIVAEDSVGRGSGPSECAGKR